MDDKTLKVPESSNAAGSAWRVLASSVRGSSHEKTGKPCQDDSGWKLIDESLFIGAVADGAGSAEHSDIGARVACDEAIRILESAALELVAGIEESTRAALMTAGQGALDAVEQEAISRGQAVRDFACTLILVVATPDGCACLHVGDGGVVVADLAGDLLVLSAGESGEYINETTFLVTPNAMDNARFAFLPVPPKGIAAFSDGLQMLAFDLLEESAHAPFFQPLFRFCHDASDESAAILALEAVLSSVRVRERTDDDVTLLIAARTDDATS